MPKSARNSRRPWRKAIFPPLMLSCLLFWGTCKPKIIHEPVLIGSVRVVAKVRAGALAWEPGEDQTRLYYVVEPAAVWKLAGLAMGNPPLKTKIERRRGGHGRPPDPPPAVVYVLVGGVSLMLFEKAVAFVKWAVRVLGARNGRGAGGGAQTGSQGNVEQKVSVEQGNDNPGEVKAEILTRIFDCTTETNAAVGMLAVEVGRLTERVNFMAGKQGEQNGDVKALTAAVSGMKETCAQRLLICEKRFSGVHEKIIKRDLWKKRKIKQAEK